MDLEEVQNEIRDIERSNPSVVEVTNLEDLTPDLDNIKTAVEQGVQKILSGLTQASASLNTTQEKLSKDESIERSKQINGVAGLLKVSAETLVRLLGLTTTYNELYAEAKAEAATRGEALQIEVTDSRVLLEMINETAEGIKDAIDKLELSVDLNPTFQVPALDVEPFRKALEELLPRNLVEDITANQNESTDRTLNVLSEISFRLQKLIDKPQVVADPMGGGGGGSTVDKYSLNGIEEGTDTYLGLINESGDYKIIKVDATSMSYATAGNNPTVTSYTDAWTNKLTLTYGRSDQA